MRRNTLPYLFAVCLSVSTVSLDAQEDATQANGHSQNVPLEALEAVLANPDFGEEKDVWRLRFKNSGTERHEDSGRLEWAELAAKIAAHLVRVLAAALAVALLVLLLVRAKKMRNFPVRNTKPDLRQTKAAPSETARSLLRKAEAAYQAGRLSEAWTDCYNCVIGALNEAGKSLPRSATEYECLRIAGTFMGEAGFALIVENRVNIAYRALEPDAGGLEESLAFCKSLLDSRQAAAA